MLVNESKQCDEMTSD